ncbi:hypothetical protein B0T25DRAFT_582049 [Lasiosphaeria hispida]|uniref:Uncharacterized protein n=1 Tax=Lasiosphaeria hispida TaxID=260671 RepID=A0AAJ0HEB4_9PEZI|nr:hypothetical protein B0T25DRAFT_582049 [Lasiosphaeria hispida]
MCMYDYTPYSGCKPGEQHSYLQWMKCNKAVSDNSYYCPIEKSIPVEELRKLSGNTLRCPIHCPIAVQQHEFLFVQRRARIETARPGSPPERRDYMTQSRPSIRRGKSVSRDEAGSVQTEEPMPDRRVVREARKQNTARDVSPATSLYSRPASPDIARPKATTGVKPVEENRQTEERRSRPPSVERVAPKEDTPATQADRRSLRASTSANVPIPVGLGVGLPPSPDIHRRSKTMTRGRSGSLLSNASNAETSKQPTDTAATSITVRRVRMAEPATAEATSSNTRQEERQMDIIEEHTIPQDTKQSRRGGKVIDPATTTTNHTTEQDQEREQRQRAVPTTARLVRSRTDPRPLRPDDTTGPQRRTNKYFSDISPTGATASTAPEPGDLSSRGKPSRPSRSPSRSSGLTVGTAHTRNPSLPDSKSTSPSTTGGMTPSPVSATSFHRQSNDSGYLSGHHRTPSQGSLKAKGGLGVVPPTPGFMPPLDAIRFGGTARPASFMVQPGPAHAVNVVEVEEKRLSKPPPQNQYRSLGVSQSVVNLPSTVSSVAAGGLVSGFDPGSPTSGEGSLGKLKRKLSGMLPWDRSKQVAASDAAPVGQAR